MSGISDDISTPDQIAAPATVTAIPQTEMATADTPIPELTPYLYRSGLACYGERSMDWNCNFDPDHVIGFASVNESTAHWWQNESEARWWHSRDGTDTISADDLTQHPSQDNSVVFRDGIGNAQIVVYAIQLPEGSWIIEGGTACAYFDGSNPASGGTWGWTTCHAAKWESSAPR